MQKIVLIIIFFVIILFVFILNRWRSNRLPEISDEDFIKLFEKHFNCSDRTALDERKRIAKYLGLPFKKISPLYTFKEISDRYSFFGCDIALNDFEYEMNYFYEKKGKGQKYLIPDTIGELIRDILEAKKDIGGSS